MDIVSAVENQHLEELKEGKEFPEMRIGDTLKVLYRIQEGVDDKGEPKFRNQPFQGTLVQINGKGIGRTMTLRKMVAGEGVERIFPIYSPNLSSIEVVRFGKARRAKLYYLRERVGKATKVKERQVARETTKKKRKKKRGRKKKK